MLRILNFIVNEMWRILKVPYLLLAIAVYFWLARLITLYLGLYPRHRILSRNQTIDPRGTILSFDIYDVAFSIECHSRAKIVTNVDTIKLEEQPTTLVKLFPLSLVTVDRKQSGVVIIIYRVRAEVAFSPMVFKEE